MSGNDFPGEGMIAGAVNGDTLHHQKDSADYQHQTQNDTVNAFELFFLHFLSSKGVIYIYIV